ncbi:hypothetical protein [Gilvimarinus sp. 1_MG-2023]|uniref:hypothetical protein n=1 Tax=Gilvimarinus sp. 1_MG-2023 TaxID=3062638 RepID=UPI0026E41257|nr:hypothetical protein [Gilvimarinus sp. 1_MG-2023]MDO6746616.1 hypothetical protein [Gilvimarinus sp. 1_MG-2023]
MTVRFLKYLSLLTISSLLASCGIIECRICGGYNNEHVQAAHVQVEPLTIAATGYGAIDPTLAGNVPQQKLMALRASEVEAYRTLAERVRGVQISANTTVSDFITDADRMSALVDAYTLRESRIVTQGMNKEGYFETTVSITLGEQFFLAPLATMQGQTYGSTRGQHYPDQRQVVRTHSTVETHYDTGAH